tara:strand:+ start:28 stop:720 length:693 start_codon:yes stop_codon:yes gene_type:complete
MTEKINTTISATDTFFDLDGNIVPSGNYYFEVKKIQENEFSGDLIQRGKYGEFRFKAKDLVKMMSVGQARLARRANIDEDGIPKCDSPSVRQNRVFASFLSANVTRNTVVKTYDEASLLKKENHMCSICLTDVTLDKKVLSCDHVYHKKCIDKWLERKSTCPVCRKEVGSEDPVLDFTLPTSRRRRRVRDELFTSSTFQERHNYYRLQLERERARYRRWQSSTRNNTYWS